MVISDIGLVDNGIADVLVVANISDSDDGIADDGLILDSGMVDDLIMANIIEVRMVDVGVCSTLEEGHGVGTEGTPETDDISWLPRG